MYTKVENQFGLCQKEPQNPNKTIKPHRTRSPQRIESITVSNNDVHYPQYRPFSALYRCGADRIRAQARSLFGLRLRTDKLRAPRDEQAGLEGGVAIEQPR